MPHRVFNIGNNNPEKLMVFIGALEKVLSNATGRKVEFEKEFELINPGDVPATYASTNRLHEAVGFKPETSIEDGLQKFADWYVGYYIMGWSRGIPSAPDFIKDRLQRQPELYRIL